jgi:hypothetical protein
MSNSSAGLFFRRRAIAALQPGGPFQINWVPETGQSNAEGHAATATYTTTQYSNLALNDSSGNYNNPASGTWSLVPALSPYRPGRTTGAAYPNNQDGQVQSLIAMDQLTFMTGGATGMVLGCSNVGQDGQNWANIGKGGTGNAYQSAVNEVQVAAGLAAGQSKTFGVFFKMITHGEADAGVTPTETYASDLVNDINSSNVDYAALTSQTYIFPTLLNGQSAQPNVNSGPNTTGRAQWLAAMRSLGNGPGSAAIVYVGPTYSYTFADGSTGVGGLHFAESGRLLLGELFGIAAEHQLFGSGWQPLWPTAIAASQASTTITVTCNVPSGILMTDPVVPPPHQTGPYAAAWANGNGLEVFDTILGGLVNGEPAVGLITNVTNASPPVVTANGHPFNNGDTVTQYGIVMGTTAATQAVNGSFVVTKLTNNTYSLNGVGAPGAAFSAGGNSMAFRAITINSFSISGNQITLTLARNPGADAVLSAAEFTDQNTPGQSTGGFASNAGNSFGRCTIIRDSVGWTGHITGTQQFDWMVPFKIMLFPTTPTIVGISPANGPTTGNTPVTIYGSGFLSTATVTGITINGVPLANAQVLNDGVITGTTAPGPAGTGPLVVQTLSGASATLAGAWSYANSLPSITAIGPFWGIQGQGGTITILGFGFTGTTGVTIGGQAATSVTVVSDTKITCVMPTTGLTASATPVDVIVTNAAGSSHTGWASRFGVCPAGLIDLWQVSSPTFSTVANVSTLLDFLGTDSAVSPNTAPGALTGKLALLGGQPACACSGSTKLVTSSAALTNPYTIGFVGASNGPNATVGDIIGTSGASFPIIGYVGGNFFANSGALVGNLAPPASLQGNGACVIFVTGSSAKIVVDGATFATGTSTNNGATGLQFGGATNQGFWSGDLGVVWIAAGQQSAGDLAIMVGLSRAFYRTP